MSPCRLCCRVDCQREHLRRSGKSLLPSRVLDSGADSVRRDLADIRKEGNLNKDEFAVAMYLINKKLGGIEPPTTLPASLIPPSLRGMDQQQPSQQSQTQKDLFDLFADSPPASAGPTQQAQQANYFAAPLSVNTTGQLSQQQKQLPGGTESFGTTTFGESRPTEARCAAVDGFARRYRFDG